jgi:two-component system response regulator YesN
MTSSERLLRKVDSVLATCDTHLFQGCLYVPAEAGDPVRFGKGACAFCRHRLEDSRTESHCRRSILNTAYQALRTGEPAFATCWLGLSTCVVPVAPRGALRGGISLAAFGFFGDAGDLSFLRTYLPPERSGHADALERDLGRIQTLSPYQARHAAAFLWDAVMAAGLNDEKDLARRHEHYLLQRRIAEQMHRYCQEQTTPDDAAELLPVISAALRSGDREQVLQLFNDYCCRVLLSEATDLEGIKAHFHLLASLLARERVLLGQGATDVVLAEARRAFGQVVQATDTEDACYAMLCILRAALEERGGATPPDRLSDRVLAWLGTHYPERVSAARVAAALGASTSAIAKALKREAGASLLTHLHRYRLAEAKDLLATTSLSVYQIADRCGYYDTSHFHRRFQREFGLGPLHFRRLARREP